MDIDATSAIPKATAMAEAFGPPLEMSEDLGMKIAAMKMNMIQNDIGAEIEVKEEGDFEHGERMNNLVRENGLPPIP